jgi:uncharacterized protein (UPF0276 family)/ribosomal protein S18 acetylase RimI-like enzyme
MLPLEFIVVTPVSHHFEVQRLATEITALSDALELRDNRFEPPTTTDLPYIYHAAADAAVKWTEDESERFASIRSEYDPDLVSLHLATRYQETEVQDGRYVGIGDPYDREQLLTNVVENVETVRSLFGDVPILLENNNHLGTDAYDVVTEPSFIDEAIRQCDGGLLFDVAHAKITAETTDTPIVDYVRALPLDRCPQVHLSRHGSASDGLRDAHAFLRGADWTYFDEIQGDIPNLRYVTLEYYRDGTVLLDQLERMQTGTSDVVVTRESWDSEFFGRSIASLDTDPITTECIDYALVRGRETDVDCLYLETCDAERRDVAQARGFDLVDTRMVFERPLGDWAAGDAIEGVRPWRRSDCPRLAAIAGSIYDDTRFYSDYHFDEATCDELYSTWIVNACEGYADEVLVATSGSTPVGFVTCTRHDESGVIGLVGVAADVQGAGVGRSLIEAALEWFHERDVRSVTVECQADNDAAVALYGSAGFERAGERYVLHHWFD